MRNALAHLPKGQNTVVAAAIQQVFLQPDHAAPTPTGRHVADRLRGRWPSHDAWMDSTEHTLRSRCTGAEGVLKLAYMTFPDEDRIHRPTRAVLLAQNDECQFQCRTMQLEGVTAPATPYEGVPQLQTISEAA